jgi:hypothetical protein
MRVRDTAEQGLKRLTLVRSSLLINSIYLALHLLFPSTSYLSIHPRLAQRYLSKQQVLRVFPLLEGLGALLAPPMNTTRIEMAICSRVPKVCS